MPSLQQQITARDDEDLMRRVAAAAERVNLPPTWFQSNMGHVVSIEVDGSTLADVHAFAVGQYPALRPGADPTYITDAMIIAAIAAILAPPA